CAPRPSSYCSDVRRKIRSGACLRLVIVGQPFAIDTSITLQLLLDPLDGSAVALHSLAPVPELCGPFDGGFVFFELQPVHKKLHWILCKRRRSQNGDEKKPDDMLLHG